jgi:hypothetical protein
VLRKSVYETINERSYKKVQQVMAYMGGLLQILYYIFYLISLPFIKKIYNDQMSNYHFDFEGDESTGRSRKSSRSRIKPETSSTKKISSLSYKHYMLPSQAGQTLETAVDKDLISPIKPIEGQVEMEKRRVRIILNKENHPLDVGIFEALFKNFSKTNELSTKLKQRKQAVKTISSKLDVSHILKKFSELEKLKLFVFDSDQLKLFDYLPKR